MNDSINERIKKLINDRGVSHTTFAKEVGVLRSGLTHVLSGRNKPGITLISKILKRYPEIDAVWLLLGETNASERPVIEENKAEDGSIQENTVRKEGRDAKEKSGTETGTETGKQSVSDVKRVTLYYGNGKYKDFFPDN